MQTTTLSRLGASAVFVAALCGAAVLGTAPASAETTTRTDCMGNNCVQVHCDTEMGSCTRITNFPVGQEETRTTWRQEVPAPAYRTEVREIRHVKPMRYACDAQGYECHYTRSYFLDDYGTPVFDPGLAQ